jgi:hypothetical protein
MLALYVVYLDGYRDLLTGQLAGGFDEENGQPSLIRDPHGSFPFTFKGETQFTDVPIT